MTETLTLTERARRCTVCRAWTWFALRADARTDRGLCLDHAGDAQLDDAPTTTAAAMRNILDEFPQATAGNRPESHAEPRTWARGTWVGGGGTWWREIPSRPDANNTHGRSPL